MVDERIDIEITDKISENIARKIKLIGDSARTSHSYVEKLKIVLNELNTSALNSVKLATSSYTSEIRKTSIANEELRLSNERVNTQLAKTAILKQRLQTEEAKTAAATARTSIANQKLTNEHERTAASIARETAQRNRALQSQIKQAAVTAREMEVKHGLEARTKKLASTIKSEIASLNQLERAHKRSMAASRQVTNAIAREEKAHLRDATAATRQAAAEQRLAREHLVGKRALDSYIHSFVIFFATIRGAGYIFHLIDGFQNLQNRLRTVADSQGKVSNLTNEMFKIANRTRTGVEETTQAFVRFDLAMIQLGASQRESLELTETVNKAMIVGGANTGEQRAGLLQLSQAFNKGKLDGDEFRTVMELMPAVAQAIANELKVTRGELLDLAPKGKTTADVMRKAFLNAKEEIDELHSRYIPTLSQSLNVLGNKSTRFIGKFKSSFSSMSKLILSLADNFDYLGIAAFTAGGLILAAFGPKVVVGVSRFFALIATNPWSIAIIGLSTLIGYMAVFGNEIKVTEGRILTYGDVFNGVMTTIGRGIKTTTNLFVDWWRGAFTDNVRDTEQTVNKINDYWDGSVRQQKERINDLRKFNRESSTGLLSDVKTLLNAIIGGWHLMGKAIITIIDFMKNAIKLKFARIKLNVIETINDILTLLNKANEFTEGFFFEVKPFNLLTTKEARNEVSKLDKDLGDLFSDLKNDLSEVTSIDYIGEIGKKIKPITDAVVGTAKEIGKMFYDASYEAAYARKTLENLDNLRGERKPLKKKEKIDGLEETSNWLAAHKEAAEVVKKYNQAINSLNLSISNEIELMNYLGREQRIQSRYMQAIQSIEQSSGLDITTKHALEIKNKITVLEYERDIYQELQTIYDEVKGSEVELMNKIRATEKAMSTGMLTVDEYTNRMKELNRQLIPQDDFTTGYLNAFGVIQEGATSVASQIGNAFGTMNSTLVDGFGDAVGRAIVYSENLGDALMNVVNGAMQAFISSMVQIGIRTAISGAMGAGSAVGASGYSTGGAAASASVGSVKAFAMGGYTGNTPRNEIAGLVHGREFVMDANSVARIGIENLEDLRRGAASVQDNNNRANTVSNTIINSQQTTTQAPTQPSNIRIINVTDPSLAGEYFNTPEGEEVLYNFISQNSETIKTMLS